MDACVRGMRACVGERGVGACLRERGMRAGLHVNERCSCVRFTVVLKMVCVAGGREGGIHM